MISDDISQITDDGFIRLDSTTQVHVSDAYKTIKVFARNPDLYMQKVLGVKYLSPVMQQAIRHVVDHKYTLIRAGHGVSKSFSCAGLIPWFLETHPQSQVYTTAPTSRQVSEVLWREVAKHKSRAVYPIAGKSLKDKLKLSEEWQAMGFASNQGVSYQGLHEKYLLWIIDEADGIDAEVWEAIESTLTGSENRLIAIGNPVDPESAFRERMEMHPEDTFVIPAFQSPNIIEVDGRYITDEIAPGCSTVEWIEEMASLYGDTSNVYKSRVLAEYPSSTPDALLNREQILAADSVKAEPAPWFVIGVDVAYDGNDESEITAISGNAFYKKHVTVQGLKGEELAQETMKFIREIEANNMYEGEPLKCGAIVWDAAGVATAFSEFIYKEIQKAGLINQVNLVPIDFAGAVTEHRVLAQENEMHKVLNKRAEMYMDIKRLVTAGKLKIPKSYDVHNVFAKIKYFINKRGLLQIQSKQEFKKANKNKSPDLPDSMILAVHGVVLRLYNFSNNLDIVK